MFFLSLAVVSAACNLTPAPQIVVTVTPNGPAAPTPAPVTPTPVPLPTSIPTPTPAPNVAIAQADTSLHNGDYDSAVRTYQTILVQPVLAVDPRLRADAMIGLGTAALREGKFNDAVTALNDFIRAYPAEARIARAYFLRGDAYMGLSQWSTAIADFQTFLQMRPGLLDSYTHERIGDAYLNLKGPEQALASYERAIQGGQRGLAPLLALREKVAASNINAGNLKAAIEQYDAILAAAKNAGYRAGIAFAAAELALRAGNQTGANARYLDLFNSYPETREGYRAMQALVRAGVAVDDLRRGRSSFAAKDYNDAIIALNNYTSKTALSKIDPVVYMILGRAYREVGNIAASTTAFQTIITQFPTNPLFGEAWLEQGRTLFVSNKVPEAIARYRELAEKHPDVKEGAEALWRAGYLYSTLGNTEQSMATFEILGNNYRGTDWAMDGLFRGGMAAYNLGAISRAQRFFSLLAATGKGDLQAAGYLWLGRLYQLDNKNDLARSAYGEAAKADPGGYYSLRAADLLAGRGPFVPPARLDWSYSDPQRVLEAEQWMRQTFKLTQSGDLWPLPKELAEDARLVRGSELWALAALDEAKGEFSSLTQENDDNPLALYRLASYYFRIGLYREAITAAARLLELAKTPTAQAPKFIAALRYPIAYADLVLPNAQKYNVDPLLVFSIMRQESLFEGIATSRASAQGLMQIIPTTGEYIARKLSWPDYDNSDLYRPHINVVFGIYYLSEQLQGFKGNVYAALAAYNAGPGASSEWLRISGGDPDLFFQAVSYDETKTYLRRIYEQYQVYVAIYGVK